MGFIKARGSNFYYEEQGDGTPILLIPPAGSTASTWGTLVGDLAGVGRVIAYDRRGYTRSGGGTIRSASEHALDAASVLEAFEARPAVVVGTSAGATIALDLAVRRPDLVRAVVVHEAAWRALRHPDAGGLGALADHFRGQEFETQVFCTSGDRTVMQARKESLWRNLLGVAYALTVVLTPGEGQLSIGLGGHEWVDSAISGAIGLAAIPPVLLGTAYGIWKENQLDKEVWQVIDERVSAPAEAGP